MNFIIVGGTRPNFIKIAPLIHAIHSFNEGSDKKIQYKLVHTGQHYSKSLSDDFFADLGIPEPHINLEAGSGTQAEQTAGIMTGFERFLVNNPADAVIVVGDVTSTMACSIVTKKQGIDLVHIEAGIRSFDLGMPEEINRLVTDAITDYFFTTSTFANTNLAHAGIQEDRIFYVGNIMIDTLRAQEKNYRKPGILPGNSLPDKSYLALTLHRPSNVDDAGRLAEILAIIDRSCGEYKVIFPVHPRTRKNLGEVACKNIIISDPMGYPEFMYLVKNAAGVITDSGGIQEETTVFGVPCITIRPNTERPETVTVGTNELVSDLGLLPASVQKLVSGEWKKGGIPELWDGKTANRIVEQLVKLYA